jgi:4-amino-4-deoxy-L-arabinose transferase-like glycosyltransferase
LNVPDRRLTIIVGLATLGLLLATEPGMAIVWDEGYTLGRVERVRLWFKALKSPESFSREWVPPEVELVQDKGLRPPPAQKLASRWNLIFDSRVVGWFWPFAREEPHGHPPFYAWVALIGDVATPWREPLGRARFGTMAFHALAAAMIFAVIARRFGRLPGIVAAACWATSPQVFGLAHYATYDGLLNSLWILGTLTAIVATDRTAAGRRSMRLWVIVGIILGAAMSTKLSGYFLVFPLAAAVAFQGFRKKDIVGLFTAGIIALVSLYVFNPSWWCEPVEGPIRFFRSNLSRALTIPIETLYFGKVYVTPNESLPWSNTLVLTVMTMPVLTLACAAVALFAGLRSKADRRFAAILFVAWAVPTGLRALPHTPGHDGVRQFVAGLGVATVLVGLSIAAIHRRWPKAALAMGALVVAESAVSMAAMLPVPLSYFSPAAGGLPGAQRLGMEPTYYWDGLTGEAVDWLNQNTPPDRKIAFLGFPTSFLYLNQTGQLRPDVNPMTPGQYRWMVIQNRPGNWKERDRAVIRDLKPAFVYEKLGVWLTAVYDMDEVLKIWKLAEQPAAPVRP